MKLNKSLSFKQYSFKSEVFNIDLYNVRSREETNNHVKIH